MREGEIGEGRRRGEPLLDSILPPPLSTMLHGCPYFLLFSFFLRISHSNPFRNELHFWILGLDATDRGPEVIHLGAMICGAEMWAALQRCSRGGVMWHRPRHHGSWHRAQCHRSWHQAQRRGSWRLPCCLYPAPSSLSRACLHCSSLFSVFSPSQLAQPSESSYLTVKTLI